MNTEEIMDEINVVQSKDELTAKEDKKKEKKHKVNKNDEELLKLQELLAQEKEKSMRIQAEMMNFRKRKEDEVNNMRKYANEDVLKKLISIVDNFERAFTLENEDNKEFLKGFYMIYTNILEIFSENGVVEIECLNAPFDPNFHQAVLTEKQDGVEAGIVIQVLQKGYMYKDKVLRATMVKVSE